MNLVELPKEYPTHKRREKQELPQFPVPEGYSSSFEFLKHLVYEHEVVSPEFAVRLSSELELIQANDGWADYLLIWWDLIRVAREEFDIMVGPGRGSSAGSLVCYLLGITQINPLEHDLLFERFANLYRKVLIDIDVEFEQGSRGVLVDYLKQKYGENHVAHIITYSQSKEDGHITGYGIHACGVILTKDDISYYTPLTKVGDTLVTIYDGHYIEGLGPVKFDILDLYALNRIHLTLKLIEDRKGIKINIDKIPKDDPRTLEAFGHAETEDIFCFCSESIKNYLLQMGTPSFEDLVALNSMYRPGPMDLIPEYIARKHGQKEFKYNLPCMEKSLRGTYGMLLYQEQLMLLLQNIADFSKADSDQCRKAFGKRNWDDLVVYYQKFISGGLSYGYNKHTLECLWHVWYKSGAFLFNKSHVVCYVFIAYQMMYLKVHYPEEFNEVIQ